jgi:MoxR-like ATPase
MLDRKIDWWLNKGLNVLFVGKHGVGKTALIKEAFERHGLKWRYFSAATMDPWTDFIGVPKEAKTSEGLSYLELIKPLDFADDSIEALFFDEFNRSPKKVRNSVLELLQFHSVNGKKFKNLKVVWAAINPDDEEETYDVEKLDPAQIDRFHVKVTVPYQPDKAYFVKKYGQETAIAALNWWKELPKEEQEKISPRRLDYALDIYRMGGDLRDVVSESSNVSKLQAQIINGPIIDKLERLFQAKDTAGAKALLAVENNFEGALQHISTKPEFRDFFFPQFPREKISSLINQSQFQKYLFDNIENVPLYAEIAQEIAQANQSLAMSNRIRGAFSLIQKKNPNWTINGQAPLASQASPQITIKQDLKQVETVMNSGASSYDRFEAFEKIKSVLNDQKAYEALDASDCASMLTSVDNFIGKNKAQTMKKVEVTVQQVVQKIADKLKELNKIPIDWNTLIKNTNLSHLVGVTVNV